MQALPYIPDGTITVAIARIPMMGEVNVLQNNGSINVQAIATDTRRVVCLKQPDLMLGDQTSTSETGTVSGSPTQTGSSKDLGSNNRKHDPAIIAGGVAGGAVFVLLAIFFVFLRHKKRSRLNSVQSGEGRPTKPFLLSEPIDPLRNSKGSVQRDPNQTSETAAEWQESWRVSPTKGLKILTVDPCSDHSGPSQEQSSSMQEQSMGESRNESSTDTPEPTVIDQPQIVVTTQDPENPQTRVESNKETDTELAFSESQYRAMQARMDRLVAEIDEISRFVPPPAYHS
ncbi:hypothetical protein K435DRAFT_808593 [Dendrothele bispora CBS 962.96]|uniref:Uncharacterized protein n=1 Tax=Dendrothele bispora (strain CBS 962.96) TaxID=1314807 RepID=A0A4S8L152_DENBC|nr:hypothetical protein K435DRAFT_808593 [Dendrothele bispora CBS 962.96]